jgi:hypothetical protein
MTTPIEQLEAMRSLAENWDGYGAAPPQAKVVSLAQEFAGLIEAILGKFTNPPQVHVHPTRVGGVLIDWEDELREHEIDIGPDGTISFLYCTKATGQVETRKFIPVAAEVVNPGFLHELRRLMAA